jgi:hypothetical protein
MYGRILLWVAGGLLLGFGAQWWRSDPSAPRTSLEAASAPTAEQQAIPENIKTPDDSAAPSSEAAMSAATADASDAELERNAALYAAEPALLDALEDATQSTDPAVRADADEFLDNVVLPSPNPVDIRE